jgi:nucleoside-diphosphate-sugar epimerase
MRIFVAGASGAIGRRLVPQLVRAGHDVVGTSRTTGHHAAIRAAGATPATMDGLDGASVRRAVEAARPEVVIHQLTALTGVGNPKRFDAEFALTNRLRTEGTDHLLAAAQSVGVKRFVAQSFTGWTNPRVGSWVKDEDDGLDPHPTTVTTQTLAAIEHLERVVPAAEGMDGIVLRYGLLYGPGTAFGPGGDMTRLIRERKLPILGRGAGVWSFVHVDDAAEATVAAVAHAGSGVFNIVDDDPARAAEWLPVAAAALEAKPPRRLPVWLARPVAGEQVVAMMTQMRGSSNARAKAELGWRPGHPSWREGFRHALA